MGEAFLPAFRRTVDRIQSHRHGWQALDWEHRRCRLHRFPYGVIYRVDEPADQIVVFAVQHLHRRPGAWLGRGQ